MKQKTFNYFLLIILTFLCSEFTLAQQADTVVIFEYIYVTDTFWMQPKPVRDTIILDQLQPIENATFLLDTTKMNANLVIFSSGKSATIPINRILINEAYQQKITSMKKITFLGLAFLALNSAIYAQESQQKTFSLYFTDQMIYQIYSYPELETIFPDNSNYNKNYKDWSKMRNSLGIGLSLNLPIKKSSYSFLPRISYIKKPAAQYSGKMGSSEDNFVYTFNSTSNNYFNYINLDILASFQKKSEKKIKPYIYTGIKYGITIGYLGEWFDIDPYNINEGEVIYRFRRNNIGAILGGGMTIGQRFYFETEVNKDLNYFVKNKNLTVKYFSLNFNFGYKLFKISSFN